MLFYKKLGLLCLTTSLVVSNFGYSSAESKSLVQMDKENSENPRITTKTEGNLTSVNNESAMTFFIER